MKPEQFIREFGVERARAVVDGAPECAEFYNNCIYVKNPHSEGNTDYFARWSDGFNAWLDAKDSRDFIDESISLSDLKRLVESLDLVKKVGGIENAKTFDEYSIYCVEHWTDLERLQRAIACHESIYGGGDA